MAIFLEGTQGIQYNDVTLGDFQKVSSAIINRDSLIVRDSAEGAVLDAADVVDSAIASLTSLFKGRSDQKERVIAALNSFYTERHKELYSLTPSEIQGVLAGLCDMQRSMTTSPSLFKDGQPYIIDLSKQDRAAAQETQRAIRSEICLSQAIESVQKAIDEINAERPIQLLHPNDVKLDNDVEPANDSASSDLEECFLLIEEEDSPIQPQAQAPKPGYEQAAARLQAIFANSSDSSDEL